MKPIKRLVLFLKNGSVALPDLRQRKEFMKDGQ